MEWLRPQRTSNPRELAATETLTVDALTFLRRAAGITLGNEAVEHRSGDMTRVHRMERKKTKRYDGGQQYYGIWWEGKTKK
jgi:hypothetical protein